MNNWKELNEIVRKKGINKMYCKKQTLLNELDKINQLIIKQVFHSCGEFYKINKINETLSQDFEHFNKFKDYQSLDKYLFVKNCLNFKLIPSHKSLKYLELKDPTLKKSMKLAIVFKHNINKIDAETLANLLAVNEAYELIENCEFESVLTEIINPQIPF
jgi:hypothetical protein